MIRILTRAATLLPILSPSLLMAVTVTVQVTPSRCGQANGSVIATANGGIPPYAFSWSTGATTASISGLFAGDYTVTVTDGLSNTDQTTATVTDIPNLATPWAMEQRPDCQSSCLGWSSISEAELQGTPPYSYDWPNPGIAFGQATFMGVCSWSPGIVTATDATGCQGTFQLTVNNSPGGQPNIIANVPACGGQANGSVTIEGSGSYAYFEVSPLGGGVVQYPEFFAPPFIVTGLAAGDYEVIYYDQYGYPPFYFPGPVYCTFPTQFTIGSLPSPCGSISGTVYHDADQDCAFNGFDLHQPYRVITIDPVGAYAITDGAGHYQQNLNYGNYNLAQNTIANETQICPVGTPVPFAINAGNTTEVVDFANLSSVPHDLSVNIWSIAARPGFPTELHLIVSNMTAFPSGDVDVDVTFDPLLVNVAPASGHWDVGVMAPYSSRYLELTSDVPANINLLGTVMNYTVSVTNTATESSLSNNTATLDVTITGSYDPNDKQGITSSALSPSQYFLVEDEWIDYTVRFQNTGTAAAETVTIRDTIDTDLFIPSLEILGASHAFTPSFGFDNPRELVFTFDNIDLADSTTDPLGSQGFISYRIKPNSDAIVGTLLENTAGIYFDFNPPIITNTVTHVVDFSTVANEIELPSTLRLVPNPASDRVTVIGAEGGIAQVEVHGADGRLVRTIAPLGNSFNAESLELGSYVVTVLLKDGRSFTARMVRA